VLDPVLVRLIDDGDDALLQSAIRSAKLSSNMRLIARKPASSGSV